MPIAGAGLRACPVPILPSFPTFPPKGGRRMVVATSGNSRFLKVFWAKPSLVVQRTALPPEDCPYG